MEPRFGSTFKEILIFRATQIGFLQIDALHCTINLSDWLASYVPTVVSATLVTDFTD